MIQLSTKNELDKFISTGEPVLIYFSGENCSVCKVLKPKIDEIIPQKFPKMKTYEVKVDLYKEIASKFSVFSIPTILVFFDSKEFFRKGRNLSITHFCDELKRPYNLFMD
ncbi:co-chaperone YbbN [Arcobacter sp. LA11]|uniref:thioredoxin family protein n=1 Tax=Arcobacter sp. LA11 TaxID=1898176 RepID=UPI000934A2CE|nr:thioredoxin family protein [Arcobacter sp. LA11]